MPKPIKPICYGCARPARKHSVFCTDRCAALYAEGLARGGDQIYCPVTGEWESDHYHGNLDNYSIVLCGGCSHQISTKGGLRDWEDDLERGHVHIHNYGGDPKED
jgi:hypothetical protein